MNKAAARYVSHKYVFGCHLHGSPDGGRRLNEARALGCGDMQHNHRLIGVGGGLRSGLRRQAGVVSLAAAPAGRPARGRGLRGIRARLEDVGVLRVPADE